MLRLSLNEARYLVLSAQGLSSLDPFGNGVSGALATIEHLGYVQIDTISVVERAHHHVIWTRVSDYQTKYIDQLMSQRKVFEYWSHAAAYLPMRDFRFSLPRKELYRKGKKHWFEQRPEHKKLRKFILDRIRAEGPLAARDFENSKPKKNSGWWDWKPSKQVLERLFMEGELMVSERRGFQKIYDLTERVLPSNIKTDCPSASEYARHLIFSGLNAHGILQVSEMCHLQPSLKKSLQSEIKEGIANGTLEEVRVEGIDKAYYCLKNAFDRGLPKRSKNLSSQESGCKILSPFDNQVIQRKRLNQLFDFDYTIECYVPEAKRKYGYFSLPIVFENKFVGRMDAKADRENKTLIIKSLHLEGQGSKPATVKRAIRSTVEKFLDFNSCATLRGHANL